MSFWDKIQNDLKKNLQEGLEIFKEGSSVFTEKIEELTGEGKKKYKVFNLNMKVQEDFAKLGGAIYDLTVKKSKNPLANKNIKSIIARINKIEDQINKLESTGEKKPAKKAVKKKTAKASKKRVTKKPAAKKAAAAKTKRKTKTAVKKKAAVKPKKS
jgi:archaellum component FlaC